MTVRKWALVNVESIEIRIHADNLFYYYSLSVTVWLRLLGGILFLCRLWLLLKLNQHAFSCTKQLFSLLIWNMVKNEMANQNHINLVYWHYAKNYIYHWRICTEQGTEWQFWPAKYYSLTKPFVPFRTSFDYNCNFIFIFFLCFINIYRYIRKLQKDAQIFIQLVPVVPEWRMHR